MWISKVINQPAKRDAEGPSHKATLQWVPLSCDGGGCCLLQKWWIAVWKCWEEIGNPFPNLRASFFFPNGVLWMFWKINFVLQGEGYALQQPPPTSLFCRGWGGGSPLEPPSAPQLPEAAGLAWQKLMGSLTGARALQGSVSWAQGARTWDD